MDLKRLILALGILALPAFFAAHARADERILDYQSEVTVNPDSSLTVTETITVRAENQQIRHGIYRDFPIKYVDEHNVRHSATFDVQRVLLDGQRAPYHTENRGAAIRVYIGDPNSFVSPGVHKYQLTYRTERQLGYFKDFDEIYWDVTGNGWIFPIDHVESYVTLPEGAPIRSVAAYTGPQGAKGTDFTIVKQSDGVVQVNTTASLPPHNGLTVAVSFPTGYVTRPSATEKAERYVSDNASAGAGIIGLVLTLIYFSFVWSKVGRDPKAGVIVPEYEPPEKFTPAGCRYVREMGYDQKAFTSAIVNMAVKGAIKIRDEDSIYTIEQADPGKVKALSAGERKIFNRLLGPNQSIVLRQSNHSLLRSAQNGLKAALAGEFERRYFARNTSYFLPGAALAIVTLLAIVVFSPQPGPAFGMTAWLSGWSVGCYFLLQRVKISWMGVLNAPGLGGRISSGVGAIFQSLFAVPFVIGLLAGTFAISQGLPYFVIGIIAILVIACVGFYHLLKAPTLLGRRILDQIEGFKLYLSVAEKDRMNFHNPPERTPELFEKFLPYALALGVENQWSEQFDDVLSKAAAGGAYQPVWYVGPGFYPGHYGDIGRNLGGTLNSAIASASAAPRSSGSGSGGGGFSGGGGGGGGGGGW